MKAKMLITGAASAAIALLVMSVTASAAVSIDFESPTYTTGALIGQDGWDRPSYTGLTSPGMDVVSGGLAGAQSASANGDYTHSVYRHMEAYTDGPGIDFYTSLLWQTDGGESVFAISANNGVDGASPVGLRILGNNIQYPTLSVAPYYDNFSNGAGAYTPGNIQEFLIGVDIGAQNYTVSWRDVTTSGAWSTPQTVAMWSLSLANAPASGVVNDVLMGPNSGAVSYDNISMAVPELSSITLMILGVAAMVPLRRGRV